MIATMPAITDEANSTMSDGTRRAMRTPVSSGTNSVHNEILKVRDSPSVYWLTSTSVLASPSSPVMKKMMMVMRKVGIVVNIIYRM